MKRPSLELTVVSNWHQKESTMIKSNILRIPGFLGMLMIAIFLLSSSSIFGSTQSYPKLLSRKSMATLEKVKKEPTTKKLLLKKIESADLESSIFIEELLEDTLRDFKFVTLSSSSDKSGVTTISGNILKTTAEKIGTFIYTVSRKSISGIIRIDKKILKVTPLNNGYHILTEVDTSMLPDRDRNPILPAGKYLESESFYDLKHRGINNVRIIIAYTPAAAVTAGNILTDSNLAIAQMNLTFANSEILAHEVSLARVFEVNYIESNSWDTDRDRFFYNGDGHMDEIHTLRNKYSADVAILVFDRNDIYCGEAMAIQADQDTAFAIVEDHCLVDNISFSHEIGHLYGCRHDIDSNDEPYEYGHGYAVDGEWRTIMAYPCTNNCPRQEFWSNPDINFPGDGLPMGTEDKNDCSRVVEMRANALENFRRIPPDDLFLSQETVNNGEYADAITVNQVGNSEQYTVDNGGTAQFSAGGSVLLSPGFRANTGSTFKAYIEEYEHCDSNEDICGLSCYNIGSQQCCANFEVCNKSWVCCPDDPGRCEPTHADCDDIPL